MAYQLLNWSNDSEPDLNAGNLNHMDSGIAAAHEQLLALESSLKVLWSGNYVMDNTQTVTLNEGIVEQVHGIILEWQQHNSNTGALTGQNLFYHMVPKTHVQNYAGKGVVITINTVEFWQIASKFVSIQDTTITGTVGNATSGTRNGITFINNYWHLSRVLGF